MSAKNLVLPIELSVKDAATIGLVYTVLSEGLPEACFLIRITNDSDEPVIISFDGVTDHEYVSASSEISLNFQSNSRPNNGYAYIKKGTAVFVRGPVGIGTIALSGYYQ